MANQLAERSMDLLSDGISEIGEKTSRLREVAVDAAEKSKAVWTDLRSNLPAGSEKVIGIAAAGLTIGLTGYLVGRSHGARSAAPRSIQTIKTVEHASSNISRDFEPVFKFLKLWMLYRAAV